MPRKIEKTEALDLALTLFWDHGYRGTSMDMLTRCLGVEKPSIYASFGSKHALYIAALQHYREQIGETIRTLLREAPSARAGIDTAVRRMMAVGTCASRKGCFGTNSALELGDHDETAREHIGLIFRDMREAFAEALSRARKAGEIRKDVPPSVLAELLVNAIEGARVIEKTHAWPDPGTALPSLVLQVLDPR